MSESECSYYWGRYSGTTTAADLFQCATKNIGKCTDTTLDITLQLFRGLFDVTPTIGAMVWNISSSGFVPGTHTKHLLWEFIMLKFYDTEAVHCSLTGADRKTLRNWVWHIIRQISIIPVVSWSRRFEQNASPPVPNCWASICGTDCRIQEPYPFDPKWYSHKFHGPGLRYEVGVSTGLGYIVWVNGPFPCGSFIDVKIFRESLKRNLNHNEMVVADQGYRDIRCVLSPAEDCAAEAHSLLRARHENINGGLKRFGILRGPFRHPLKLHADAFHACAVLVQLGLQTEDRIYSTGPSSA